MKAFSRRDCGLMELLADLNRLEMCLSALTDTDSSTVALTCIFVIAQVQVKPIKRGNRERPCMFILWKGFIHDFLFGLEEVVVFIRSPPHTAGRHIHHQ